MQHQQDFLKGCVNSGIGICRIVYAWLAQLVFASPFLFPLNSILKRCPFLTIKLESILFHLASCKLTANFRIKVYY